MEFPVSGLVWCFNIKELLFHLVFCVATTLRIGAAVGLDYCSSWIIVSQEWRAVVCVVV